MTIKYEQISLIVKIFPCCILSTLELIFTKVTLHNAKIDSVHVFLWWYDLESINKD